MDDSPMEFVTVVFLLVLSVAAIWLAYRLFLLILGGAIGLFVFASEQGFVGIAAYIACWVFMFPIMVIASLVFGILGWRNDRDFRRETERLKDP